MNHNNAINKLAYQLIYPGVLGSLIFDLADPFRSIDKTWFCSFLILLCFIADYLHMSINLEAENKEPKIIYPMMDIVIAIIFCISYFSLAKTTANNFPIIDSVYYFTQCLVFFWIVHVLIIGYEKSAGWKLNKIDFSPVAISTLGLLTILCFGNQDNVLIISMVSLGLTFSSYVVRIFRYDIHVIQKN